MKMSQARGLLKSQKLKVKVELAGKVYYLPIRRNDFLAATAGLYPDADIPAFLRSEDVTIETRWMGADHGRIKDILFEGL